MFCLFLSQVTCLLTLFFILINFNPHNPFEQNKINHIYLKVGKFVTKPPIKKIADIGIAVHSINEVLPFYTSALELELEQIEQVHSEGVKIAFLKIGDTRFELLEPLHNDSPIQKFIHKKGEGIHHIALEVDDIDQRLEHLKNAGIHLIDEQGKIGAEGAKVAFIHPKAANGVLYELSQPMKGKH